jgi:transcriptional regulator with XRE-family HTH domain
MIDREALGSFLRHRRESLQPEDVGLMRGQRRRTTGLRREEVAGLSHMSSDYYARLERGTGPHPSEQMVAAIAQGLHLTLAERDHFFRLAGHTPPLRGATSEFVSPGMLRILDRLEDTPAEIITEVGDTLRQTPLGVAVLGDATLRTGPNPQQERRIHRRSVSSSLVFMLQACVSSSPSADRIRGPLSSPPSFRTTQISVASGTPRKSASNHRKLNGSTTHPWVSWT